MLCHFVPNCNILVYWHEHFYRHSWFSEDVRCSHDLCDTKLLIYHQKQVPAFTYSFKFLQSTRWIVEIHGSQVIVFSVILSLWQHHQVKNFNLQFSVWLAAVEKHMWTLKHLSEWLIVLCLIGILRWNPLWHLAHTIFTTHNEHVPHLPGLIIQLV